MADTSARTRQRIQDATVSPTQRILDVTVITAQLIARGGLDG